MIRYDIYDVRYDMIYDTIWYDIWRDMAWLDVTYGMIWRDMAWLDVTYDTIKNVTWHMIYDMTWHDMTWYDMIWYDMIWYIWYDIWYDMIWYDMTWHDMIRYMIWYGMIWYDMIWYKKCTEVSAQSTGYYSQMLMKFEICQKIFEKFSDKKFTKIRPHGTPRCSMRTDEQTWWS